MPTLIVPALVWVLLMAIRTPEVSPVVALLVCGLGGSGCLGGSGVVLSATLGGLVGFTGMGTASGFGTSSVLGLASVGAGVGFSEVSTLSALVGCFGGRGRAFTMVACTAPSVGVTSPQLWPVMWKR